MTIPSPLIHYSNKPLKCPRDTSDHGDRGRPQGLWVSVGDAWLVDQYERWRANSDRLGSAHYPHRFKYANNIFIADAHNILVITNEEEFRAFNDQYSEQRPTLTAREARGISWGKVRKHYQGMIIAPHLDAMASQTGKNGWQLPVPESYWYYTWVVASGCLWDVSVIENIITSPVTLPPY
jgi:hypothetical protein